MIDGWIDQTNRTLINFPISIPKEIMFLKLLDASKKFNSAHLIFEMITLFRKWEKKMLYKFLIAMQLIIWLILDFLSLGIPPYFGTLVLHIA